MLEPTGDYLIIMSEEKYDIMGITEIWLDESFDWLVNLQGYSLFRKDCKNQKGVFLLLCKILSKAHSTGRNICGK